MVSPTPPPTPKYSQPRTEAYRQALESNPSLIAGKTVVDVGCGTGILSMFAARGGAACVVGVEASGARAGIARANVSANALGERVRVVHARAEALTADDLPAGGADVLVSEWMGYALLFEAMLDAVLLVRDRFLRPGGAVLPDLLAVHAAGAGDAAAGLDYWRDVYGFRMPAVAAKAADAAEREALVRVVPADCLVTAPVVAQTLDLATMAPEDQDFTADLTLTAAEGKDAKILSCIVLWFDARFSERFCRDAPVTLDTSPAATPTHWAQTVLKLRLVTGGGVWGDEAATLLPHAYVSCTIKSFIKRAYPQTFSILKSLQGACGPRPPRGQGPARAPDHDTVKGQAPPAGHHPADGRVDRGRKAGPRPAAVQHRRAHPALLHGGQGLIAWVVWLDVCTIALVDAQISMLLPSDQSSRSYFIVRIGKRCKSSSKRDGGEDRHKFWEP